MPVASLSRRRRADTLYDFVTCADELLASDDEYHRRELESQLQAALPAIRETPLFDVFMVRHPALRAMLDDIDYAPPTPLTASKFPTYLAY